jgi:hypothetical protein
LSQVLGVDLLKRLHIAKKLSTDSKPSNPDSDKNKATTSKETSVNGVISDKITSKVTIKAKTPEPVIPEAKRPIKLRIKIPSSGSKQMPLVTSLAPAPAPAAVVPVEM